MGDNSKVHSLHFPWLQQTPLHSKSKSCNGTLLPEVSRKCVCSCCNDATTVCCCGCGSSMSGRRSPVLLTHLAVLLPAVSGWRLVGESETTNGARVRRHLSSGSSCDHWFVTGACSSPLVSSSPIVAPTHASCRAAETPHHSARLVPHILRSPSTTLSTQAP